MNITCEACSGSGLGDLGQDCPGCDGNGKVFQPSFYSVAIYLEDRAYGGVEEGGWWYNCGELINDVLGGIAAEDMIKTFPSLEQAELWEKQLQSKLDAGPNIGRRSINSVLSEGRYTAMVVGGYPAKHFPPTKPHYE